MTRPRAVVLFSGGLDSTVLAYRLRQIGWDLHLLSVDYGQRHIRELTHATATAAKLDALHSVVEAPFGWLLSSALTGTSEVPHGHYADDTMRATVVPNRNAILLSLAWGVAVAEQSRMVAIAVHAGDHPVYPDCRPEFIQSMNRALRLGTARHAHPSLEIVAPFAKVSKAQIVGVGAHLDVPWADTWSCYEGGELHCGGCGTCVERIEAFAEAGVVDPTTYLSEVAS